VQRKRKKEKTNGLEKISTEPERLLKTSFSSIEKKKVGDWE